MSKSLTPLRAIRAFCLDCCSVTSAEVRNCIIESCALYPYRLGRRPKGLTTSTPLKSIRKRCFACGEGTAHDIAECKIDDCPIFYYRFGKNPKRKGIGNRNARFSQKPRTQHPVPAVSRVKSPHGTGSEMMQ